VCVRACMCDALCVFVHNTHTHTQANRMYVNFFDVPAQNCGYNGATFGG